jgi:hypothetical protein
MSAKAFYAIAQHTVSVAIEAVVLRRRKGRLEVLLFKRPDDDPFYGGMWHSPGTILRGKDAEGGLPGKPVGYEKAFDRLARGELKVNFAGHKKFAGSLFFLSPRGPENCLVFVCRIAGEPVKGTFYPVDDLPENTVLAHRLSIIPAAVKAFAKRGS